MSYLWSDNKLPENSKDYFNAVHSVEPTGKTYRSTQPTNNERTVNSLAEGEQSIAEDSKRKQKPVEPEGDITEEGKEALKDIVSKGVNVVKGDVEPESEPLKIDINQYEYVKTLEDGDEVYKSGHHLLIIPGGLSPEEKKKALDEQYEEATSGKTVGEANL